jgi:hypothetical protein
MPALQVFTTMAGHKGIFLSAFYFAHVSGALLSPHQLLGGGGLMSIVLPWKICDEYSLSLWAGFPFSRSFWAPPVQGKVEDSSSSWQKGAGKEERRGPGSGELLGRRPGRSIGAGIPG